MRFKVLQLFIVLYGSVVPGWLFHWGNVGVPLVFPGVPLVFCGVPLFRRYSAVPPVFRILLLLGVPVIRRDSVFRCSVFLVLQYTTNI